MTLAAGSAFTRRRRVGAGERKVRKTRGGEACFLRSRVGFPPTLPGAGAGHYSILRRGPAAVAEFNSAQTTHGKVMYA